MAPIIGEKGESAVVTGQDIEEQPPNRIVRVLDGAAQIETYLSERELVGFLLLQGPDRIFGARLVLPVARPEVHRDLGAGDIASVVARQPSHYRRYVFGGH